MRDVGTISLAAHRIELYCGENHTSHEHQRRVYVYTRAYAHIGWPDVLFEGKQYSVYNNMTHTDFYLSVSKLNTYLILLNLKKTITNYYLRFKTCFFKV